MAQDQQVKGQRAERKRAAAQEYNQEVNQRMGKDKGKDKGKDRAKGKDVGGNGRTQPST
jgi:hypothetical protein